MEAAILHALGEVPRFGTFEEPQAQDGETLVDVTAAPIKPLDRMIAAGTHYSSPRALPVIAGMDGAGRLADGTPVYFAALRRPFGSMAQRAAASWHVPIPRGLDDAVAATIVNPALAAWLPLAWRGGLVEGETVLVMGATGAAGKLAVKVARLLGAHRVIAAGRRQEVLADLGADATIDLRLPQTDLALAFAEQAALGIDIIVDYLWGPPVETLVGTLVKNNLSTTKKGSERGIRLVSVGEMAGKAIALPSAALRGSALQIIGSGTANFPPVPQMQAIVGDILGRAAAGELTIDVERIDLADVADAWLRAGEVGPRPVLVPRN